VGVFGDLALESKRKGLLKRCRSKITREKRMVGDGSLLTGILVGLSGRLGGKGDGGEIVLGAAGDGSNLDVSSNDGVGDGGFVDNLELRVAFEGALMMVYLADSWRLAVSGAKVRRISAWPKTFSSPQMQMSP
jgi:hypothetical protein